MAKWDEATLTGRQKAWFASVRGGLKSETGRDLQAWAEIARGCPQIAHRARLKWLKEVHGLGQNRASLVLAEAFPTADLSPDDDNDPLWADAPGLPILTAVRAAALDLGGVVVSRRKGYTAFSRGVQFAAVRPLKDGSVRLGLALQPDADPRLTPPARESWSERLKSVTTLADVKAIDTGLKALLRQAWDAS